MLKTLRPENTAHCPFIVCCAYRSCYNALDRWVEVGRGNQACFVWEGNGAPVFRARTMSYREVLDETCRLVRTVAWYNQIDRGQTCTCAVNDSTRD